MNSFYFYTETAFHHEGDFQYLLDLITESKKIGANGIKFQVLIDIDTFTSSKHGGYNKIKSCIFSEEQWIDAFKHANNIGLDVIVMPLDENAFEVIRKSKIPIKFLDLHSVSFYDEVVLSKMKETQIPLILGVGGRTLPEIQDKVEYFGKQLEVLMIGFQAFPSKLEDIKIERIRVYNEKFPGINIGYTDHSSYDSDYAILGNDYAYILGARVFEKHLTLFEGTPRIDYEAAIGPSKMIKSIEQLKYLSDQILNRKDILSLTETEVKYRNRQRVGVAARLLKAGEKITPTDIKFKMIDKPGGIAVQQEIIGKMLQRNIDVDDVITSFDLSE